MVSHIQQSARSPKPVGSSEAPEGASALGRLPREAAGSAVLILQVFVILLFVVPSNTTIATIGAVGFPAGLVGMLAAGLYLAWTLCGFHRSSDHRYPTKVVLITLWLTSLASYVSSQFRERSVLEVSGADRWLLMLISITGVALLAAEGLRDREALMRVLRTTVWAGSFCALVAVLQFWLSFDFSPLIGQSLPGFTYDSDIGGIQMRGAFNRVPGTTLHPIELGAGAAMLLPLAIAVAALDKHRPAWVRGIPILLLGLCLPMSVSRSAVVAFAVMLVFLLAQVGLNLRLALLAVTPLAVVAIFVGVPGFMTTIGNFFLGAGTDPSVTTRTDDYGVVVEMVLRRPLLGAGGGTYLPDDPLLILDNTYLKWVVEFGVVGLLVLVVFVMVLPVMAAVTIRRRAQDAHYTLIAAALSASLAAAAVTPLTFDALAFPTVTFLQFLLIGLVGAVWRLGLRPNPDVFPAVAGGPGSPFIPQPEVPVDTLNVYSALRRNGALVLTILVAMVVAVGAVFVFVKPSYTVTSTLLMMPPRPAPSDSQYVLNPDLVGVNSDNPYTRMYDPLTMFGVLATRVTSHDGRAQIEKVGGSREFEVDQVVRYGNTTPFAEVTARASTPEQAATTNRLVIRTLNRTLAQLQRREGASPRYFITTVVVKEPRASAARTNGVSKVVLGIIGLGIFLMFAAVGVGDAVRAARTRTGRPGTPV